jgi:serine phosphatase RsbU (regulator of sigma subunit)
MFVPTDTESTLSGKSLVSTIRTMAALGPLGQEVLDAYGIQDVDPQGWYPFDLRQKIHRIAHERFGDEALFNFGLNNGDHYQQAQVAFNIAGQVYDEAIRQGGEAAHSQALQTLIQSFSVTHAQAIRDTVRKAPPSFGAWVQALGANEFEYHMNSRADPEHEAFNRGILAAGFTRWLGAHWTFELQPLRDRIEVCETHNHFVWHVAFKRRTESRSGNELAAELRFNAREALMSKVLADAEQQRKLARRAMDELDAAHRLVLDSIRYASLLQQAQLPRPVRLAQRFEDWAVHWEPRDTIGGDLWWISAPSVQDRFTVCVVDCSGHGVPGAMLALLASTALERIYSTEPHASPARGLALLSQALRRGLNQDQTGDTDRHVQNDGCDAAFVQIDCAGGELKFAAANMDMVWMPRDGDIRRIAAQACGLGYRGEDPAHFEEHRLSFSSGDRLLITTDGYVDQIGQEQAGQTPRALGYRRMLSLLAEHRDSPLQAMMQALRERLVSWQGNGGRRDDTTLVALQLQRQPTVR